MYRALVLILLVGLLTLSVSQAEESRVALVIGNSHYSSAPLDNPVHDAQDMAAKLRKQGFDVVEHNDVKMRQIGSILSEFRRKLQPGGVALVFYAGHGLQIKDENYFPAVDAEINAEEDVPNQSIALKQVMDVLDDSKTKLNLMFLDACRDNPYARSFRSGSRGLAEVKVSATGTLISYATRPGGVAADGKGRNGLYTSKLLKQLDSTLPVELSLKLVVTEVKKSSQGKQEPWMEGYIEGDFCFAGCNINLTVTPLDAPPARQQDTAEVAFWNSIKDSQQREDFDAYLQQYPKGAFAPLASLKLKRLAAPAPKPAPALPVATLAEEDSPKLSASCTDCPEMVDIPAGSFMMGSPEDEADRISDEQLHNVTVRAFALGKYEVTQAQWQKVMGDNPSGFKECGGNCPVEQVSWDDVQAFIQKLNQQTGQRYRLPTEAEWEYAARAGTETARYWGDAANQACAYANVDDEAHGCSDGYNNTAPVGRFRPNRFGLYDMLGNVWEWTCSAYTENGYDGSEKLCNNNANSRRVPRGGSWAIGPAGVRRSVAGLILLSVATALGFVLPRIVSFIL